jgi:hypothetical protein
MIKQWRRWLWMAGIASSLGLTTAAMAQSTPFQPFKNLFGSRNTGETKAQDSSRSTEIQVELAWLADGTTFPYFLEAKMKGSNLEVRGYVPNKIVRDQAISLAKINCPLPTVDLMKEHPSVAVRVEHRPAEQLKGAVQTALRENFPGQVLHVQAFSDGTVQISGSVRNLEQKLAVSQSLRRLHGCASISNLTQTGTEVGQNPTAVAKMAKNSSESRSTDLGEATGKTTPPAEPKRGLFGLFGKSSQGDSATAKNSTADPANSKIQTAGLDTSKNNGSTKTAAGVESHGIIVENGDDSKNAVKIIQEPSVTAPAGKAAPKAMTGTIANAGALKKRIETAVPTLRNVTVTFTSKTDVRVECTIRPGDDSAAVAGQILSIRELGEPLKVDLQIVLPDQK